jgi:hypothetical protein
MRWAKIPSGRIALHMFHISVFGMQFRRCVMCVTCELFVLGFSFFFISLCLP